MTSTYSSSSNHMVYVEDIYKYQLIYSILFLCKSCIYEFIRMILCRYQMSRQLLLYSSRAGGL